MRLLVPLKYNWWAQVCRNLNPFSSLTLINRYVHDDQTSGEFNYGFVPLVIDSYTFTHPDFELSWETIDKGMQRLPNAFLPFIRKEKINLQYNSEVYKLEKTNHGKKVRVHWRTKGKDKSEDFDRVIVTPPLGVVRHWDLPSSKLMIHFVPLFVLNCNQDLYDINFL